MSKIYRSTAAEYHFFTVNLKGFCVKADPKSKSKRRFCGHATEAVASHNLATSDKSCRSLGVWRVLPISDVFCLLDNDASLLTPSLRPQT